MVSFSSRRVSRAASAILAFAALAVPALPFAQRPQIETERRDAIETAQRERRDLLAELHAEIEAVEAQDGALSADLIAPLTALSLVNQESGEHLLAAAASQRALEVTRYHHGLHALEQAPLMRQLIQAADALGDATTAWDTEQSLLSLARRHPEDLRTARILRDVADRRMEILRRYTAGDRPAEIILGCYYAEGRRQHNCHAGSRGHVERRLVREAQAYYAASINIILENEQYRSEALPELLMELVLSSHAYDNPELGERSLRYLLAYQATNSASWQTQVETLVAIADWQLLHARGRLASEEALGSYEYAYGMLEQHGAADELVEQIFAPAVPIALPAFVPSPLPDEATRESASRNVNVAFEVGRYGRPRRVRILDRGSAVTRGEARRLVNSIWRSRFRPGFIGGEFADSRRFVVRYRLSE
jgi:hypothetical protein